MQWRPFRAGPSPQLGGGLHRNTRASGFSLMLLPTTTKNELPGRMRRIKVLLSNAAEVLIIGRGVEPISCDPRWRAAE